MILNKVILIEGDPQGSPFRPLTPPEPDICSCGACGSLIEDDSYIVNCCHEGLILYFISDFNIYKYNLLWDIIN